MGVPMAAPRDLRGRPAAPGRALGAVHRAEERPVPSPGTQGERCPRARWRPRRRWPPRELKALSDRSDAESAGILDFQIELLLDGELLAPALERIGQGEGAALAFAAAMNAHMDTIAGGGDAFALQCGRPRRPQEPRARRAGRPHARRFPAGHRLCRPRHAAEPLPRP